MRTLTYYIPTGIIFLYCTFIVHPIGVYTIIILYPKAIGGYYGRQQRDKHRSKKDLFNAEKEGNIHCYHFFSRCNTCRMHNQLFYRAPVHGVNKNACLQQQRQPCGIKQFNIFK